MRIFIGMDSACRNQQGNCDEVENSARPFLLFCYDRTNRLYDAALLTRCYTQHALRPVIDSKINHKRHFIKIPFINKGMDFIDLPSIFRDKSVQSSIPNYCKNCEVPIICYKYNKPIRGAIFNFNKLVSDLDIETFTPDS